MSATIAKPRRPWLAALLALLGGPLGHMYSGCLLRGLLVWMTGVMFVIVLLIAIHFIPRPMGIILTVIFSVGFEFFLIADAYRMAKLRSGLPLRRYQRWWVYVLAYVAVSLPANALAHAVRSFATEAFAIPTRSMSPTLLPGDCILTDKLWSRPESLRRDDLIVFHSAGPDSALWVMRVVGLPGDTVEIRDEKVWLNGEESSDPHKYTDPEVPSPPELSNFGPLTVPAESVFVLGDNRRRSNDSRTLGPIPFASYHARATLIYFSIEQRFPDPTDTSHYESGPIRWSRIGQRLD